MKEIILNFERELRFGEAEETPVERLGVVYNFWMASFALPLAGMAPVGIARRGETGGRS